MPTKTRSVKPRSADAVPRAIKRRFDHVTKVREAPKSIVVEVTDADSQGAIGSDFEQCAFARAACRQLKADRALVSKRVVYIIKGDTAIRYAANERLRGEIKDFDRYGKFASGHYTLPPKKPSEHLGVPHPHHDRERHDPRPRHDESGQRWMGVRDLNVADAVVVQPKRKKR